MKLAIIFTELLHYHVARYQALWNYSEQLGHQTLLLAVRPQPPELPTAHYYRQLGDKVHLLSQDSHENINSAKMIRRLLGMLNSHQPDAVLIPGYRHRYCRAMLRWCRQNGKGAVLMSESRQEDFTRSWGREWLKRQIIQLFDAALVGGKPHRQYAQAMGVAPETIFTGYNAVDNVYWHEETQKVRLNVDGWRKQLNLPTQYFITANRFIEKKNLSGLLKAYARYVSQTATPPWHLILAGTGPLETQLKQESHSLNLDMLVHFPGYLSTEDLIPYFALASGFVHASSHAEQWGLVVNEAMAAGLPVIVSETVGCVEDLIVPGVTGWTFDPRNIDAIATALQKLSTLSSDDWHRVSKNALDHIETYSPRLFAEGAINAAETAFRNVQNQTTQGNWSPVRFLAETI